MLSQRQLGQHPAAKAFLLFACPSNTILTIIWYIQHKLRRTFTKAGSAGNLKRREGLAVASGKEAA